MPSTGLFANQPRSHRSLLWSAAAASWMVRSAFIGSELTHTVPNAQGNQDTFPCVRIPALNPVDRRDLGELSPVSPAVLDDFAPHRDRAEGKYPAKFNFRDVDDPAWAKRRLHVHLMHGLRVRFGLSNIGRYEVRIIERMHSVLSAHISSHGLIRTPDVLTLEDAHQQAILNPPPPVTDYFAGSYSGVFDGLSFGRLGSGWERRGSSRPGAGLLSGTTV